MSLLDELANYRSTSSFLSEFTLTALQLTHPLSLPALAHPQIPTYSIKTADRESTIDTPQMSPEHEGNLERIRAGAHKEYYQEYSDKFRKMSSMVALLSAKARKIKYQFMVHLERYAKKAPRDISTQQKRDSRSPLHLRPDISKSKNEPLLHSSLSQIFANSERTVKQSLRAAFTCLKKQSKFILKLQLLQKELDAFRLRFSTYFKRKAWNSLKNLPKRQQRPQRKNISMLQRLTIPRKLTAMTLRLIDNKPLSTSVAANESVPSKLPSLCPHSITTESLDYHDNVTLFMEQASKSEECSSLTNKKTMDLSFSNNVCVSIFEADRDTSSQRSFIKQLSDAEITAAPQPTFAKRNISDFTACIAEHRANQNYSQVEVAKAVDTPLNLIKSEVHLHNKEQLSSPVACLLKKEEEMDFHSPKGYLQTFSNQRREDEWRLRSHSGERERVERWGSEARMTYLCSYGSARQSIDCDFEQQMRKYTTFKQYLQKRRQTTLKGIQKNQEILKKLMIKLERSKHKVDKIRLEIKPKEDRAQFTAMKQSLKFKPSTPSKSPRKHLQSQLNSQSNSRKSNKQLSRQKSNSHGSGEKTTRRPGDSARESVTKDEATKNIDIYYSYMKQKKMMGSAVGTPTKKADAAAQGKSFASSRKHSAKEGSSHKQKNLLAISKFGCGRQQRIDLKLDFGREQLSKKSRGGPPKDKVKPPCVQVPRDKGSRK